MSKTRKLLSVVLALVMLVSVFAVSANAYGYEDADTTYTQNWVLGEPVDNGDGTYTVEVSLTTNYATGAIQFVVTNTDNTVAALVNAEVGSAIPAAYGIEEASFSNATGKVILIPDTSSDKTITATAINGVIAVLTYEYSGEGSADIAIANNPKTETNVAGSLMAARMDNGDLVTGDMITGQTVTSTGETWTIGDSDAEAPTLAVIDGMNGVIDTERTAYGADFNECTGYIYGVEPENYEGILDVFEVVGDGEAEIIENEYGSDCGTGTIVNVLDSDGNAVETYVLVIFGDVDGSGDVTTDDSNIIDRHDNWMYYEGSEDGRIVALEVLFAADVTLDSAGSTETYDYDVTTDDSNIIDRHDNWMYYDNGSEDGRFRQSDVIDNL